VPVPIPHRQTLCLDDPLYGVILWALHITARRHVALGLAGLEVELDRLAEEYTSSGATVTLPRKTITHDEPGIWDGDTVAIRLGQSTADGHPEVQLKAIDTASGKVYGFPSGLIGSETCGEGTCTHVKPTLSGMLRAVGPKFGCWFASDGKLLKFDGPIGTYTAE
jgi:hypothetical protein